MPKNSEQVHDKDRFWDRTDERGDAGELEQIGEEQVWGGIYTI